MEQYSKTEVAVGVFVLAGAAAIAYLSISLGGLSPWPPDYYRVRARFASVGDLSEGAPVKLAGVSVGEVGRIRLVDYAAEVELAIEEDLALPADTIASIRTTGLLGETFVSLSPGGAAKTLGEGDRVAQTEPAVNLIDLLAKYAFGSQETLGPGGGGGEL